MSLNELVAPLGRVPLFADLEPHQLMALVRAAHRVVFQPGDPIIEAETAGQAAFLIMQGDAILHDPDLPATDGAALETFTLLGEMAMLIETDYAATVRARTVVRTLKFTRAAMHELMEHDVAIAEHFVSAIAARLAPVAEELRRIDQLLAMQSAHLSASIEATPC